MNVATTAVQYVGSSARRSAKATRKSRYPPAARPAAVPAANVPVFPLVATGSFSDDGVGKVTADVRFRAQDVGSTASLFVFALAPAPIVHGAAAAKDTQVRPMPETALDRVHRILQLVPLAARPGGIGYHDLAAALGVPRDRLDRDLAEITEPILACPNDPDDVRVLSEVQNTRIDDVFLGSPLIPLQSPRAAVFARSNPVPVATKGFADVSVPLFSPDVLQGISDRLSFGTPTVTREMDIRGAEHFVAFLSAQRLAFTAQNLQKVGYATNPLTDGSLKQWNVMDGLKVNGAGSGFFEYRVPWPEGVRAAVLARVTLLAEVSAKQLFGKDREGAGRVVGDFMRGEGTHDPGLNPNAYPMTDATRFPSVVTVRINGALAGRQTLEDDPADHRGILSWHYQKRDRRLREAGSYGELLRINIPREALERAAAAGELIIRLEVNAPSSGGLAIYGRRFGRLPLDPTLVFVERP